MPLDFFGKTKLPAEIPAEMEQVISSLRELDSPEACLKEVFRVLSDKYHGSHFLTYPRFFKIFTKNAGNLWKKSGFMHCTNINYLARILLLKSDKFNEDDIKLKWTLVWYVSPHQYLQVRVDGKWIDVDIWGKAFGIKFGDHSRGFH